VSPRRKIDPAIDPPCATPAPKRRLRWGLPVIAGLAAVLIAGAVAASTFLLIAHESNRRAMVKDVAVLDGVRSFMTAYTSPDPFHANDYADNILRQGTGDFAKVFQEKENEIVLQVARAEPTTGSVLEAGVQRWNEDGSADVLVATEITSTSPDGKTPTERGNRWVVTAIKEGQQWKISHLVEVI
jgi:Mce-associated membrane protein